MEQSAVQLRTTRNFLFHGKTIFITIPQSGDLGTPLEINNKCQTSEWGHRIAGILTSRERHQDGGTHYHIGIKFTERWHLRSADTFFKNFFGKNVHIQSMRSPKHVWEYIKKDGDFDQQGELFGKPDIKP